MLEVLKVFSWRSVVGNMFKLCKLEPTSLFGGVWLSGLAVIISWRASTAKMAQTPKVIKINSLVLNRRIVVPPYLKIMTANLAKATVAVKTVYSRGESYEELHSHKVVHVMADTRLS